MERQSMFLDWIINIIKMAILPKASYGFNAIPIKLLMTFFTELQQSQNLYGTTKDSELPKQSWGTKNQAEDKTLPDLRQYYKAIIIKIVCDWHKNRHTDQWNRIERPKINPDTYSQSSTKEARIPNGKKTVLEFPLWLSRLTTWECP